MVKCAACGKFLPAKGVAMCSKFSCTNRYHLACLLLPEKTQIGSDWLCPDCKRKVPRGDNSATPVKELNSAPPQGVTSDGSLNRTSIPTAQVQTRVVSDSEPSPESQLTLREEIRLFRSELREVRDEVREFRREMTELHSSMGVYTERVDVLEARIEALENKPITAPPDTKISQLELTVTRLQHELNDRDQELLSSDLEIANIPEISGENVSHTIGLVAAKLGVALDERDIVFAQRVGPRTELTAGTGGQSMAGGTSLAGGAGANERARRIVVRLTRRALRDDLLQSARVRRGATTADLGFSVPPRRFYLNERLSKLNKYLFYRAREAGGRLGWKYVWSKSGRILAKQGDGKPTHRIRSEEDLGRVFGQEAFPEKDV